MHLIWYENKKKKKNLTTIQITQKKYRTNSLWFNIIILLFYLTFYIEFADHDKALNIY